MKSIYLIFAGCKKTWGLVDRARALRNKWIHEHLEPQRIEQEEAIAILRHIRLIILGLQPRIDEEYALQAGAPLMRELAQIHCAVHRCQNAATCSEWGE